MNSLDVFLIIVLGAPTIGLIAWAIRLERKRWRGDK